MPLYLGGDEVQINIGDEVYTVDYIISNATAPILDDSTTQNSDETILE
jgi:hypothetical protein